MIAKLLLVGGGGALGSIARYALSGVVQRVGPGAGFPWGTLAVNVTGCLLIGLLAGLAESRHVLGPDARHFLLIGVLGGFTTFSTFGYETVALARDGSHLEALLNAFGTMGACLVAVWLGYAVAAAR